MLNFHNKFFVSLLAIFSTLCIAGDSFAYTVNGLVAFSYSNYSHKVGDSKSSYSVLTENYQAQIAAPVFDPRFLRITAGAAVSRTHSNSIEQGDTLSYNANAAFFPGRPVSWFIFGSKSIVSVDGGFGMGGYDVDSVSYGANMKINLNALSRRLFLRNNRNNFNQNFNNNNDNNNENNNNNGWGRRFLLIPLPEILLSYDHTESTSDNNLRPIDQTRDATTGSIRLRPGRSSYFQVDASKEEFENRIAQNSYDRSSLTFDGRSSFSNGSSLVLHAKNEDLRRVGYAVGGGEEEWQRDTYTAKYDVKSSSRFSHEYSYGFSRTRSDSLESRGNKGSAIARYWVLPELNVHAGLVYSVEDSVSPAREVTTKSTNASAGAAYRQEYDLEFLDPFVFYTNYNMSAGKQSVSSSNSADKSGRGLVYNNDLGLGLRSEGWKHENLALDYSYLTRRDHSPAGANQWSHRLSLSASTNRVTSTTMSASVFYTLSNYQSGAANFIGFQELGTETDTRSLSYNANITNTAVPNVILQAGAQRSRTTSSTDFTLATVQMDFSQTETLSFASASWSYRLSRGLGLFAGLRDQLRRVESRTGTGTWNAWTFDTGLNYTVRKITCDLTYRFKQEDQPNNLEIQEQVYSIRISRPF
jgi:hypothetical protein